jgi:hypothetical protein
MALLWGYLAPRGGWTDAHGGLSVEHGGRNPLGLRSASRVCEILRDEPLRLIGAEDAIVIAGEGPAAHRGTAITCLVQWYSGAGSRAMKRILGEGSSV